MNNLRIESFDSSTERYERAFATFLAHTDQKDKAREWLDRVVDQLPSRRVFVDAGAGNGKVTAWLAGAFERTLAIEPNPHLRRELTQTCPGATVISATVLEAGEIDKADFVLSSHVLYYIPGGEWLANVERLASLLSPTGALVVILQNSESDCMRLLERFHGRRFHLQKFATNFREKHGGQFGVQLDTVESHVVAEELETACAIAEFMLNLLPLTQPSPASELEAYVRCEFAAPGDGYRFSCSQDMLTIRPRSADLDQEIARQKSS